MFEFIRTHRRLMHFALLLFIVPSFAFVGIQSYANFGDSADTVVKVGDQSISKQEWEAAQQEQMEQLRQRFGAQFDPKVFDTPQARQRILDNLVAQRVLSVEAARSHLTISDQTLQQSILAIPGLTGPDGKFDVERYKSLLAAQGMTPAMYEVRLRQDLALQQINASIQSTAFVPKAVAARLSGLNDQERVIQQLRFNDDSYAPQVKLTDAMIKAYYDHNSSQFTVPEQVNAQYVVLSSDVLAAQIQVSDADIKTYYDQNLKRYAVEEQRRASHILIAVKKDATPAEIATAKAKADKLLLQVRTTPADFAKIAKANSDDPGSGERGGDLGLFGPGMMVKPFDTAVFQLKRDDISDLVRSDFGFHIIQLTEIKSASVKTLDQVKADIAAEIKKQLVAKKYAEAAEIFTNTAYEQAGSLKPLADKLKLTIETATNLKRTANPDTAPTAVINNQKFLTALFTNDALHNQHNTEAVETAPMTLVVGHVLTYAPASTLPLDAVLPLLQARVTKIEAQNLARKAGQARLAELKKTNEASLFPAAVTVSRIKNADIDGVSMTAIMKADTTTLPAFVGVDIPGQGYNIFRISQVQAPAQPDAARRLSEQQQLSNTIAQEEMLAYIDVLKQKAKVKYIHQTAPETLLADDKPARETAGKSGN